MSERHDYTNDLRVTFGRLMSSECVVVLDARQVEVLISALERIASIGDIGFQLEECQDLAPGHALSWDNGGTHEQDALVDDVMDGLAKALFYLA